MYYPDIRLIKDAYAVIESVPEKAFSLAQWRLKEGKSLGDGTVCCAAGWLTLHPKFEALGLTYDGRGRPAFGLYRGYAALAALFRIDTDDAVAIFSPAGPEWTAMTDKAVWMNRVRTYLARHAHKYPH